MKKKDKIRLALKVRRKSGFTLIELLIVITIIGMLALLAIGNFTLVQQQARIGFAADTLVSALREAQVLAKSGRRGAGGAAGGEVLQCRAVKIVPGIDLTSGLYVGQSDYIGLAEASAPPGSGDSCKIISDQQWQKSDIFDSRISVVRAGVGVAAGVQDTSDSSSPQIYYFKPPFGQIYQEDGGNLVRVKPQVIDFVIGAAGKPDSQKILQFDLVTGVVARK